jgi:C-terminal processing protease CtpA/Prc
VVLVNEKCASSTEYLTQIAKQSPGVTVMGSPTAGVMDYGDLRRPAKLPCPDLHLQIAMAKSPWTDTAPIDPTGILPDISLAHLPESQWLGTAVKMLQSNTLAVKP